MRKIILHLLFCLAAIAGTSVPARAASVVYISSTGTVNNFCTPTQPCTIAAAVGLSDAGGEMFCLDRGPYLFGAVTLRQAITIDCAGAFVGGSNTSMFTVNNSDPRITIKFRNIIFEGYVFNLPTAVLITGGGAVIFENCTFQHFFNAPAVQFKPTMPGTQLVVRDSVFDDNGLGGSNGGGLQVIPQAGGSAGVVLDRVRFSHNVTAMALNSSSGTVGVNMKDSLVTSSRSNGILSQAGSTINFIIDHSSLTNNVGAALQSSGANSFVRIGNSTISANDTGVSSVSGGTVQSFKNNQIFGNGTNGTPLTAVPGVTGNLQ